jgi:hypothetical protein
MDEWMDRRVDDCMTGWVRAADIEKCQKQLVLRTAIGQRQPQKYNLKSPIFAII